MLNFQGFPTELDTKEDFLWCTKIEKERLPNFYLRFLQLKAQALEVSDDQGPGQESPPHGTSTQPSSHRATKNSDGTL
jgi:hypothetical protein